MTAEADYNASYEEKKHSWEREGHERKNDNIRNGGNDGGDSKADDNDESGDDSDDESYYDEDDQYPDPYQDKYVQLPDPGAYTRRERKSTAEESAQFEHLSAEKRLQVVVKLANIHLFPEKPSYGGGSWHIEVRSATKRLKTPSAN